jgi:agmatine deiminase
MMMDIQNPRADGFAMPAEFASHQATLMAWPARDEWWGAVLDPAKNEWAGVARAVAAFEPVTMVCNPGQSADVRRRCGSGVEPLELPIDDSWMRDNGPIFVADANGDIALVQFRFNSWGEKFLPYDNDVRVPEVLASHLGVRRYQAPFVLEGGSFFVDGEGTLLTTEQCLLHPNRNPSMSREEIEDGLRSFLGVETVIWLPHGLVEDRDTDGHVDGLAQYVRPGAVMMSVAAGDDDPNAARFDEDRAVLSRLPDAGGRTIDVLDGPVNAWAEVDGVGRVVIPYLNFYVVNRGVIVPVGGVPEDEAALEVVGKVFPDREVVGVPAALISHGGGGPHCITQQVPAGSFVS